MGQQHNHTCMLTLMTTAAATATVVTPPIKLYTHTACPFAQRVWIALEASGVAYEKVEVNLYGRGGFDKAALKQVETSGGLSAKGYIPVMAVGDEVIRESSVCVQRVADLAGAALRPDDAELAATLIKLCNALPKQTSSREIDALLRKCDDAVSTRAFLAGATLSVADVNLLPFLQRVEDDIPADAMHLRGYMARVRATPAFSKTVVPSWWWWW